jgi:hypothetical protein
MKRMELLACGLILMLLSVSAIAQEVAPTSPEAIDAKIKLLKKQRDEIKAKIYDVRKKITQSDAVADLRKAAADASKTYEHKKDNDPAIIAAKKADSDASAALKAIVLAKVKSSLAGAAILKEIATLEEKAAELSLTAAVAELKMKHKDSPISRALAKDPMIMEFYATYQAAEKGEFRDKAKVDYYKLRQVTMEKMPQAKLLIDEIAAAEKGIDDTETAIETAEDKLDKLYDAAADSDDQDITVAKAKRETAQKAYQQAYYGGAMQEARDARSATLKALSAKVKMLAADDTAGAALQIQSDALDKEYYALKEKARAFRKKSSE